jgi:hypothetical protein
MKFDMGQAWNDALAILRANQQVVLVVAGVFFFLPNLALLLLMPVPAAEAEARAAAGNVDFGEVLAAAGQIYAGNWWQLVLVSLLTAVGTLGLMALLTDRSRPTVGEALKTGVKCLLPYIGVQILTGFIVGSILLLTIVVGSAAGLGPGLLVGVVGLVALTYVLVKFSLTLPVIVIENVMNPISAIARSWALTKGNSVRLFLFYMLLLLVFGVIAAVLGIVGSIAGLIGGAEAATFVGALINAAVNMIGLTVYLAVQVSAHRQLSGHASPAAADVFE